MQEKNDGEVQPLSREEWLERVMQEGRDEVIRREMIRMGFWSEEPLPPEELEKQAQEEKELAQLKKELESLEEKTRKLGDLEAMIRKRRQERIEESKRRRAQRKEERARRRAEAQARWKEYREQHVIHVGEGFSGDLERLDSDAEKLRESGLPLIHTPQELAEAMEIPLGRLKWLTYHRDTATISHYHHFTITQKKRWKADPLRPQKTPAPGPGMDPGASVGPGGGAPLRLWVCPGEKHSGQRGPPCREGSGDQNGSERFFPQRPLPPGQGNVSVPRLQSGGQHAVGPVVHRAAPSESGI